MDSLYQRAARAALERQPLHDPTVAVELTAAELRWLCDRLHDMRLADRDAYMATILGARLDAARLGLTEKEDLR